MREIRDQVQASLVYRDAPCANCSWKYYIMELFNISDLPFSVGPGILTKVLGSIGKSIEFLRKFE